MNRKMVSPFLLRPLRSLQEFLRARRHELEKQLLTSGQAINQLENEIGRVQSRLRLYQVEAERHRQEHRQER